MPSHPWWVFHGAWGTAMENPPAAFRLLQTEVIWLLPFYHIPVADASHENNRPARSSEGIQRTPILKIANFAE